MKEPRLPRLPLRFLRWFCKEELIDEIEGDLLEAYQQRYRNKPTQARFKFYKEVMMSFNKRNIGIAEKYRETRFGISWSIIKQYGRILFRTVRRSKTYSSISISSLILSLTCAGLIYQYLNKELTYDRIYDQADKIHRINHLSHNSGRSYGFAPIGMVPHLIENLDAVEDGTRIFKYRRAIPVSVESTNQSFNEPRFGWVDPSFFDIFDLNVIQGSAEGLKRPKVVMISNTIAKKYFADKDPIGQKLVFNWSNETALEVVGVYEDFPTNTSFQLDLVSNIETCRLTMWTGSWFTEWKNMFTSAYVVIKNGREQEVEEFAQQATSAYFTPEEPEAWETSVQRLTDIHLAEPMDIGEWSKHNDVQSLILFGAIGIIILCLGCFNFINMVTAQAGQRAKEVGVRKVLGSRKKQITQQTLFETFVFVLVAGVFALGIMYFLLPLLGRLTGHSYELNDLTYPSFIIGFIGGLFVVAILAGAYPALHISRINPLYLMRKNHTAVGGSKVRNTLVTFQFMITGVLVICTLMVFLQMQYIRSKDLGFDDSAILTIPIHNDDAVIPKINAFRNELKSYSGIKNVTAASHEMLSDYTYITNFIIQEYEDEFKWERYTVEQDYLKVFDLEVIAGRGFDSKIPSDSNAFVLNESAVRAMNLTPEEAVNLNITDEGLNYSGKIVGVVKDFHFRSLHHSIQPFVMYVNWDRLDYISVSMSTHDFARNIEILDEKWTNTFGESVPFFFDFLDQQTNELYQSEDNEGLLFSSFSLLSVILGALGLFGSALFTTERRFKEIGLRKVLGANTNQLIMMINRHFIRMLSFALIVAAPIAFWLMNEWLEGFAYRIEQPIWVYVLTATATFSIASLTVSYLSWKAASSNPVDAIKVE